VVLGSYEIANSSVLYAFGQIIDIMTAIKKIEDLEIWVVSRQLVQDIYLATACEPAKRDFVYCDQVRRASISIMSNVAEGFGRFSDKEFARFLDIAKGSALEVQSLLHMGRDIGYLEASRSASLIETSDRLAAQITALCRYLRQSDPKRPRPKTQDPGPRT